MLGRIAQSGPPPFDRRYNPTEVFDFTKGTRGLLRGTALTCSGGVNGTVVDPSGNIVAASAPRITHDPVGITNWCMQSEALNVVPWSGNPTATVASETYLGSSFWTLAKTQGSANEGEIQAFRPMDAGDSATCTLALLAGTSTGVTLGFYGATGLWGLDANATAEILAGPGTLTRQIGAAWQVTNLSATVPTVLAMRRVYPSMDTLCSIYIYPGTSSSTTIGHSIKVARPMVEFNVAKASGRYLPTTTLPVTIRDCLGLLVEKASTNKVTQSQASTGFVAGGTTPPTVTSNVTYLGEVSTHILFPAGSDVAYAGCRASRTGNQFAVVGGQPISCSINISLNRALTGSEQVVYYPTGASGGSEWVLTAFNSAQFVGRWGRIELPNMVMGGSGNDFANFQVKVVLGSALSLYVCKEQDEDGPVCTSYIPTLGATVSRTADQILLGGTGFSGVFNAVSGGTAMVSGRMNGVAPSVDRHMLGMYDTPETNSDRHVLYVTGATNNQIGGYTESASVAQQSILTNLSGSAVCAAFALKTNDFALCLNGGAVATDTSGTLPPVTRLYIGSAQPGNGAAFNGTISKVSFYPSRLTDAEMQTLTTL